MTWSFVMVPAKRQQYIGSSDVARIMSGELEQVWREKLGLAPPPAITGFNVDLGRATEAVNLAYFFRNRGALAFDRYDSGVWPEIEDGYTRPFLWSLMFPDFVAASEELPYCAATPDAIFARPPKGWADFLPTSGTRFEIENGVDAKHRSANASQAQVIEDSFWQCQYFAWLFDLRGWWISPIYGNELGEPLWISVDAELQLKMIDNLVLLNNALLKGTPPPAGLVSEAPPIPVVQATDYGKKRVVKVGPTSNIAVALQASLGNMARTEAAAITYELEKKAAKALMPDDARLLYLVDANGEPMNLPAIERDRGNKLSFKPVEPKLLAKHDGLR